MIAGLSIADFTLLHVVISLIGIVSGLVALFPLIGNRMPAWMTVLFLASTVLTSVTGFMFPGAGIDPAKVVGAISLVALAIAILALYGRRLAGIARPVYVVAATLALYLNCFVAVVQAFQKVPFLQAMAPTQSEPPFLVAQLVVLALFIALGYRAVRRFRP